MKIIAILAILVVIVAVIVAAIYFMGQFEQTKPVADTLTGYGTQAVDYVKGNIPTVVAAGGAVTAIGGAALSKINSAKQQVSQVTDNAKTQVAALTDEKKSYENQITDLKKQLDESSIDSNTITSMKKQLESATETKTQLSTMQANFSTLQSERNSIKMQYDDLLAQHKKAQAQLEVLMPKVK